MPVPIFTANQLLTCQRWCVQCVPIGGKEVITYAGKKFVTTGHSRLKPGATFRPHSCDELLSGKFSPASPGARFDASSIFCSSVAHRGLDVLGMYKGAERYPGGRKVLVVYMGGVMDLNHCTEAGSTMILCIYLGLVYYPLHLWKAQLIKEENQDFVQWGYQNFSSVH